jgi:predicted nucleic acid-binding protein
MRVFFDTNVLVAASIRQHPHFDRADALVRRCVDGRDEGIVHAHSLLEFHSAVTQLPGAIVVPPQVVESLLGTAILPFVRIAHLSGKQIRDVQARAGRLGLIGGIIYDFYHLAVAEKEHVDRLYTFNAAHFRRIAPDAMKDLIAVP